LEDYDYKIPGSVVYKLENLKQKSTESVKDFYSRVDEQIDSFYEGFSATAGAASSSSGSAAAATGAAACRMYFQKGIFIGGLKEEIKSKVLEQTLDSMSDVRNKAMQIEFITQQGNTKTTTNHAVFSMEQMDHEIDSFQERDALQEEEDEEEMQEDEIALLNRFRKRMNRRPMRRGGQKGSFGGAPFPGKCYNCNMAGHRASTCRRPKEDGHTVCGRGRRFRSRGSTYKNW